MRAELPEHYQLYLECITVIPKFRKLGFREILVDFVKQLEEFAEKGIIITKIYTVGFTEHGENLCKNRKLEMKPIGEIEICEKLKTTYCLTLIPFSKNLKRFLEKCFDEQKDLNIKKLISEYKKASKNR